MPWLSVSSLCSLDLNFFFLSFKKIRWSSSSSMSWRSFSSLCSPRWRKDWPLCTSLWPRSPFYRSPLCGLSCVVSVCVHTHMCMCLYTHFRHSPGRFCYVCVWSVWVGVGVICVLSVCECIHTYRCVCVCTHTYARHSAGFHVCHGTAKNKTCKKKTCLRWPNPLILIILNSKP